MIRSVPTLRLPALMLALLAVIGLMLRGQAVSVPALVFGTLCHVGTEQHDPAPSPVGCDSCLLCQAIQSDHAGIPILPATILPWTEPGYGLRLAKPIGADPAMTRLPAAARARAPPGLA